MFARAGAGGLGYGEVKKDLLARVMEYFEPMRTRRDELASRPDEVDDILADGVARARAIGAPVLAACREAAGLGPGR
jgi:tryptophanyl-tRNA synthetase